MCRHRNVRHAGQDTPDTSQPGGWAAHTIRAVTRTGNPHDRHLAGLEQEREHPKEGL